MLLKYYGLPTLAMEGNNRAKWNSIVSHMQTRECDATQYIINGRQFHNFGDSDQTLWGGWGSNKCTNCYNYYGADWNFYVPSIPFGPTGSMSIWVGTGGANKGDLSQDGVEEYTVLGIPTYPVFYEYVTHTGGHCAPDINPRSPYNASPGDEMYFYTDVTGYQVMDDFTSRHYSSLYWGCSSNDSAEFILERNGGSTPIPNFGTANPFHAEYEDSTYTWYTVPNNSGGYGDGFYRWQLINGSNQLLVGDGSVSADPDYGSYWTWTYYRGS